jgi:hypothetical protein
MQALNALISERARSSGLSRLDADSQEPFVLIAWQRSEEVIANWDKKDELLIYQP